MEQVQSDYGAIYKPNQSGLFAMESRAHRVGDILTVSFTESFQATKSQNAASSKSSDSTVTLPNILEKRINIIKLKILRNCSALFDLYY
mgnify:CR=1 FL=1